MEMNNTQKKFANGFSFLKYFWVFFIVCILGYIYESILTIFQNGGFISRQGLIFGPFIPVYGLGAILMMFTLKNIKNWKLQFLVSGIVGAGVEFIYSYVQEKLFGTVSWDYSDYFLNLQGRTSIIHAIFWGVLGVVFIRFVYPHLSKMIEKIPLKLGNALSYVFVAFMAFNMLFTVVVSSRQYRRLNHIPPQNIVDEWCDEYYPDHRLLEIYSNHERRS